MLLLLSLLFSLSSAWALDAQNLETLKGLKVSVTDMPVPLPGESVTVPDKSGWHNIPGGTTVYADNQRPATLAAALPDGTLKIDAVRWSKTDGKYNWDVAAINPDALEEAYWGQETSGVGHAYLVFKFKQNGFSSYRAGAYASNYLVVSVEARKKEGQSYSPITGEFGGYKIVWDLSTLESFIYDNTAIAKTPTDIYPFNITLEQKKQMAVIALQRAVADHSAENYNTLADNCVINALGVLNTVLGHSASVHEILPVLGTKALLKAGLIANPVHFTPADPTGGGFLTPQ